MAKTFMDDPVAKEDKVKMYTRTSQRKGNNVRERAIPSLYL